MFTFNFASERYVQPHVYATEEEEGEDELAKSEPMDTTQREQVPFKQFVFSPSRVDTIDIAKSIPKTLLPFAPNVLNGLESIDDITGVQKCVLSIYNVLPMPVIQSPIVTLLLTNVPRGAKCPEKRPHLSWVQSGFQLRSLVFLVHQRIVPFHSSISDEYPQECHDEMLEQIASYEEFHQSRLQNLFDEEPQPQDYMDHFIGYLEDFAWYYLNTLERFLFKTLIEPHESNLELEHVLTPRVALNLWDCHPSLIPSIQKCVVDFFTLHVQAIHKHEQRHAGPDYVQKNCINLQAIQTRITCTPLQNLYRGYIDRQTMEEYWEFSKIK